MYGWVGNRYYASNRLHRYTFKRGGGERVGRIVRVAKLPVKREIWSRRWLADPVEIEIWDGRWPLERLVLLLARLGGR